MRRPQASLANRGRAVIGVGHVSNFGRKAVFHCSVGQQHVTSRGPAVSA